MNTRNNSDDIAYRLLDELNKEEIISQRALADRLGIALGLVNTYIKRLYKKGHIKIKTLPRNRIKYIVTPQGLSEKTRLTYKYMHYSILYFKDIRNRIEGAYAAMVKKGVKQVLLWGDGELAELCYISTRGFSLEVVGVVDRRKAGRVFFERQVYAPEDVDRIAFDAVLISSLDEKAREGITAMGIVPEKIYSLEQ